MDARRQQGAPVYEALTELRDMRMVPFDVPGHKRGRGSAQLREFLGERCLSVDVNSMKLLDNLCHPVSVIRDAEELAADAFGAACAFFMVGGTTSSVQAMILYACGRGDKIILPRNVHRSVINALILTGAVPVYVNPRTDPRLGIALGMSAGDVEDAIARNGDAKAVFINNPTYYGICSDIETIARAAHAAGMLVLADEAHGTQFYFGADMPRAAMAAGADMSSVGAHKSGNSLTQSSFLICGERVNPGRMRQMINLTQTTSASYLLLSSLDICRRDLALRGAEVFAKSCALADYARGEINAIGDYYAFSSELVDGGAVFDFDRTKLSVNTLGLGLAGIEVYAVLRDEYDIQIEFGDIANILAYITAGDKIKGIERLISALHEIRRLHKRDGGDLLKYEYIAPQVAMAPQDAFYAERKSVPIKSAVGEVCTEFVMCYPPGIPILAPGERVTREIADYIAYAKEKGCSLTGAEDMETENINVCSGAGGVTRG
jgi:arginine/lysine/ornithine decarboxylase